MEDLYSQNALGCYIRFLPAIDLVYIEGFAKLAYGSRRNF